MGRPGKPGMARSRLSRFLPQSARGGLFLLLVIAFVPWIVAETLHFNRNVSAWRTHELEEQIGVARSVSKTFEAYINDIQSQQAAIGLVLTSLEPSASNEANEILRTTASRYPSTFHYCWISPQGRLLASSMPEVVGRDVRDRTFFTEILGGKERSIGDLRPPEEPSTDPSFVIASGIRDKQGGLQGVVMAAINAAVLDDVLRVERLGGASVGVIDRQGRLVYRSPEVELPWEKRNVLKTQPFIAPALAGEEVVGTFDTLPDGQRRMAAYTPIGSTGWIAGGGSLESEVMGPVIRSHIFRLSTGAGVWLLALVAAVAAGHRLVGPLRSLRGQMLAFGRGETKARVEVGGPRELRELADSFNQMAESVEARTRELTLMMDAIHIVSESDDLDTGLNQLAAGLASAMDAPICRIALLDDDGQGLIIRAVYSALRPGPSPFLGTAFPIEEIPPARHVIDQKQVVELKADSSLIDSSERERWKSLGLEVALGAPLQVGDRVIGLINLADVKRRDFTPQQKSLCLAIGRQVAGLIEKATLSEQIAHERERLSVTLSSIGDGVIATDTQGRVTMINGVAQALTGWNQPEALGRKLDEVFHIVDERNQEPLENPVKRVLETGRIVGLANHTALIARDGEIRSIADSAAPILDRDGNILGVVLVFRDVTMQRRAEEALLAGFKQFATVFDSLNALVYVADTKTYELLFMNSYGMEIWGRDTIGKPCFQVLQTGQTQQCAFCTNDILLRNGVQADPYVWEFQNTVNKQWYLCIDRLITWVDGRIARMEIAVDITEQKRAEQALRESQERFQGLVETTADWVWEVTENGVYTYASPRVRDVLGYEPQEIIGRTPFDLMPEKEAERVAEAFADIAQGRKVFHALENVNRHKDGRLVVLETSGAPFFDANGTFRGYRGIDRDVTERKRLEDALRENAERFRALAENSSDAVYVLRLRPTRAVDYMNPACAALTGYTLEEMSDLPPDRLVYPEDRPIVDAVLSDPAAFDKPFSLRWVHKDGSIIWLEHLLSPIYDDQGLVVAVQSTARDVTERRQAEEQIERLRNQFLGMVSHELRTPITVIKGAAATELAQPSGGQETQELLQLVSKQADRLRDLVNDLLEMTRVQAGRFTLEVRPTDLKAVIGDAIVTFGRAGNERQVHVSFADGMPMVNADPGRVGQVVLNLLSNAHKASPPDSSIQIEVEHDGVQATVHIRDQGRGLKAEEMRLLFKAFSRLDDAGASRGTGLGLSISKGIVEAHGGRIWAASEGLGKGATFSFTLPLAVEEPAPARQAPDKSEFVRLETQGKSILVVDDEQEVLRFLDRCLKQNGYRSICASDPASVIELVETERPDLVLLDVMLPGTTGFELLKRMREFSEVPVIFLSARSENEAIVQALRMGADDYITKPFTVSELLARMEVALRKRQSREETTHPPFVCGELTIDFASRHVTVAGDRVSLSATEYKLLYELATNAGRVLTHQQLLQRVWGPEYSTETELLRSFVRNVRRKLGDEGASPRIILTERQVGYYVPGP